ncbi:MAG: SH3 domain-containing protein [bacterium]|nr:SH3 domain-containing protein [bacterium]
MRESSFFADGRCVGFLFLLVVLVGCEAFRQDNRERIYVTATVLNLRDQPTTNSSVVARLKRGQELVVMEQNPPWLLVELDDKAKGWVHGSYVGDPTAVRTALQTDLSHRSQTTPTHVRQKAPQGSSQPRQSLPEEMAIDDMLEGLPDDLPIEEMEPLEGQSRYMGAASGGQVVVEFWGKESDLQRAEIMVSTVDITDSDLRRNAEMVRQFVQNAIPQWKRETDWVVDFLRGLSSKDKGEGGFDTKSKAVRFLFVKPLGAIRVTIEKV